MLELTPENFDEEVTQHEGLVVVDFWADWCGPCKVYGPIFEEASENIDDVKFAKLDVNEWTEGATFFGVQSIPTTLLLKNGKEIDRLTGVQSLEGLQMACEKHMD